MMLCELTIKAFQKPMLHIMRMCPKNHYFSLSIGGAVKSSVDSSPCQLSVDDRQIASFLIHRKVFTAKSIMVLWNGGEKRTWVKAKVATQITQVSQGIPRERVVETRQSKPIKIDR